MARVKVVARVVVAKARVVFAQVSAGEAGVCTWPSELQSDRAGERCWEVGGPGP